MKRIIFTTILLLVFCFSAYSQANDLACPANFAVFPQGVVNPDETVKIGVNLSKDANESNLKYEWTISAGKLVKGQGTSEVEIATSEENEGSNITVSVKVKGLEKECVVSEVFGIASLPIGEPVDSIGKIKLQDYLPRIDAFFHELIVNKDYEGLITIDFDRKDSRTYKKSLLQSIQKFIKLRKFDSSRITFAIADSEGEITELWLVPPGAYFPKYATDYTIIKGEDLEQKINELFSKK